MIILLYIVIGGVAAQVGITEPLVASATAIPEAPNTGGGLIGKISAALAPIGWAFNAVGGLFQLATFQAEGVPPLVNTLIFAPVGFLLLWTGIKLIRGTG